MESQAASANDDAQANLLETILASKINTPQVFLPTILLVLPCVMCGCAERRTRQPSLHCNKSPVGNWFSALLRRRPRLPYLTHTVQAMYQSGIDVLSVIQGEHRQEFGGFYEVDTRECGIGVDFITIIRTLAYPYVTLSQKLCEPDQMNVVFRT